MFQHTRDDIRRELDLEAEGLTLGAQRYRSQRPMPWSEGSSSEKEEADLPPGKALVRMATDPVAEGIREFVDRIINRDGTGKRPVAANYLFMADPLAAAHITVRHILQSAVKQEGFQTSSIRLGKAIIHHIEMLALSKEAPAVYKALLNKSKRKGWSRQRADAFADLMNTNNVRLSVPRDEVIQIGAKCMEIAVDTTGLFELDTRPSSHGSASYFIRTSEVMQRWLEQEHGRCELMSPFLMPMVVRPKRWRSPFVGGYLKRRPSIKLFKWVSKKRLKQMEETADLSRVYAAVNAVQDTPWRINVHILDLMTQVWDTGGVLGGLPTRNDEPLPPRPDPIVEDSPEFKAWKSAASRVYARRTSAMSGRLAFQQKLWIAHRFAAEPVIYFPHCMDFRGRVYPIPTNGPHPQSDDAGKALLQFAEGKPLGALGAWWLAVHIANLFGVDKVSFEDRVRWTIDNTDNLIDSVLNPLDGERFWTTADSPWCALAAAMDYVGYLREGEGYISHTPIALDGSCSGLQHFSAMLRDRVGGAAVNLIPSDKPSDLYSAVASRAQEIIDVSDDPELEPWKDGKVTRKIAKRPCMTFCYSATRYGMVDMILQTLNEIDADNRGQGKGPHLGGLDNYKAASALSYVLWAAIGDVVMAAADAMDWLKSVARAAAKDEMSITWVTPMGLPVTQDYRKEVLSPVRIHWQGKALTPRLRTETPELDKRGQVNGIAPNFIHSMDAAHLQAVVLAGREAGLESLALIHDSFATHPCDTELLSTILRETLVEQYSGDVLKTFEDQIATLLSEEARELIKPRPSFGTLDLQAVKESRYVFA